MAGIIAGALGGLGEAAIGAGRQLGDYASRSAIQAEAAEIQKMRDATMERYASEREIRQDTRADTRQQAGFTHAEKLQTGGFEHAERVEKDIRQPFQREENAATRALTEKQLTEQSRHNKASEGIQGAAASRAQQLLDEQIKDLGLARTVKNLQIEQAQETKKYRDLATNEADPAKREQYREMYQLLTGKDNDNFAVTLDKQKDEMGLETVRGVIKTDKRSGKVTYQGIGDLSGNTTTYKSAEEVKAAHKAGKIDRVTAIKELGRFGYK